MSDRPRPIKPKKPLAPWQIVAVVVSVVVAAAGGGLMLYQAAAAGPSPVAQQPSNLPGANTPAGFAPTDTPPDDNTARSERTDTDRLIDSTSGAVFRLGFGFFAGFAIGYAMRAFVKITLVIIGVALLGVFGLQYAGLVAVDWEAISGGFETFGSWASAQTKDFANFITGYLPSAGAGLAGAAIGFRRR